LLPRFVQPEAGEIRMLHKIVTVVIVGAALATTACNTVRGAARDVNSVANCTENVVLEGQNC
jgi:predicted small secreted protein